MSNGNEQIYIRIRIGLLIIRGIAVKVPGPESKTPNDNGRIYARIGL